MAREVAANTRARSAARRRLTFRRVVVLLVFLALSLLSSGSTDNRAPLQQGLDRVTSGERFSLVRWELWALGERAGRPLSLDWKAGRDISADRDAVIRYVQLTGELGRVSADRDRAVATTLAAGQLIALDQRAAILAAERESLRPIVETIIAWQLEQVQAEMGIRRGLAELRPREAFPFFDLRFVPPVAFRLGETPELLVVAPRNRIQLVDSVLLEPDISFSQIEEIEAQTDGLGASSLVTGIGGLAAYPSMVPASSSLTWTLQTVAHEWAHHYLAFRPLGLSYFRSYEMRTINETAADIIGEELARSVYARYYSPPAAPWPEPPSAETSSTRSEQPTFPRLMRSIRLEVEEMLARGDVAGAEAYMAEQQRELARKGYYVRRLNTAYLSFFGAYSGSSNPYEAALRALRKSSGSLAAFMESVSAVGQPSDLGQAGFGGSAAW